MFLVYIIFTFNYEAKLYQHNILNVNSKSGDVTSCHQNII